MTQQLQNKDKNTLTSEDVFEFLKDEPEFFQEYPEILDNAQLTQAGEGVASLTMRQLSTLREKNTKLQHQLDSLLDIARENDALFGRMQNLTTALIDACSVEDVFATLDDTLRDCFGADFFAIRLIAMKNQEDFPISEVVWDADATELTHFKKVLDSQKIKCGHPTHAQAEVLFKDNVDIVLSTALIPFKLGEQQGLLAIGSKDGERFHPSMGNLFLTHLGQLVGKRLFSLQAQKAG
jgi:uncharacterized protein YigA (DUF484 family)